MKNILKNSRKTFTGLLLLHLITTFIWVILFDAKKDFSNEIILFTVIIGDIIAYILHYVFFIKKESNVTKENKETYIKGILLNNIAIITSIQLLLIVLCNYEIMLSNNTISSRMSPLGIICTTAMIKLFTSIIYYLFTNTKKVKENKFLLIPFGIQITLFLVMTIINEISENIISIMIIQGIILTISNFLVLKNRKKLSRKFNIKEDKLCKRFYLIFFLSFIPLLGITILLNEMGLILTCGGMFCGLGIAILLFFILPILEVVLSIICICIAKSIKLYKEKKKAKSIFCFLLGTIIIFIVVVFIYAIF